MNTNSKQAKARDLTALIEDARQKSYIQAINTPRSELESQLRSLRSSIYTELYARHLREDDLDTLYKFYSSETGNRILVGLHVISREYQQSLRKKLRNMAAEFSHRINQ